MPCANAAQAVGSFFDAYRAHDVDRMVDLCDEMAAFRSVSFEVRRRQRVIRGDGKVRTIGKIVWAGLIEAFPDLANEVMNIISDNNGNVAAEVRLGASRQRHGATLNLGDGASGRRTSSFFTLTTVGKSTASGHTRTTQALVFNSVA